MSLTGLQLHFKGILNGLSTSALVGLNWAPAEAFVAPPVVETDTMSAPQIYIWGGEATDSRGRSLGPRNRLGASQPVLPVTSAGWRYVEWELDVWLMLVDTSTPDNLSFPYLIDAVRKQIATDLMPVWIDDAGVSYAVSEAPVGQLGVTGDLTQLVAIGESMRLQYTTPQGLADQRSLLYAATLTVQVREAYQL